MDLLQDQKIAGQVGIETEMAGEHPSRVAAQVLILAPLWSNVSV